MRDPESVLAAAFPRNEDIDQLRRIAGCRCARLHLLPIGIIGILTAILSFAFTIPLSTLPSAPGLTLPLVSCLLLIQGAWNLLVPRLLCRRAEALVALAFLTPFGLLGSVCLDWTPQTHASVRWPVGFVLTYLGVALASFAAGRLLLGRRWGYGAEATAAELEWLNDLVRGVARADDWGTDIIVLWEGRRCLEWRALLGEVVAVFVGSSLFCRGLAVLVAPKSEVVFVEEGTSLSGRDVALVRVGRHRLRGHMGPNNMRKYQVWKHRSGGEGEAPVPSVRAEQPALADAYFAPERHSLVQGLPRPGRGRAPA